MAARFFFNESIIPEVYKLINEAKDYVFLITPYFDLMGHLENHLERTKAKVTVIIRDEKLEEKSHIISKLKKLGVDVRALRNLHAKIYLNEKSCIISSMNLYSYSVANSEEIAVLIDDKDGLNQIRKYIKESLYNRSKSLSTRAPSKRRVKGKKIGGYCIRCGTDIKFNPEKPYCLDCYDSWSEYENYDYREQLCHHCGKPNSTSMSRPLCGACFRQAERSWF